MISTRSFARIFFRNSINIGLPLLEIPEHRIESGHELEVDMANGRVTNRTKAESYTAIRIPTVMIDILNEGGLVAYLKKYGEYKL